MTRKQLQKTIEMVQSDHLVRIYSGHHVSDFVDIFKDNGVWVARDGSMGRTKLLEIPFDNLAFYKRIDVTA